MGSLDFLGTHLRVTPDNAGSNFIDSFLTDSLMIYDLNGPLSYACRNDLAPISTQIPITLLVVVEVSLTELLWSQAPPKVRTYDRFYIIILMNLTCRYCTCNTALARNAAEARPNRVEMSFGIHKLSAKAPVQLTTNHLSAQYLESFLDSPSFCKSLTNEGKGPSSADYHNPTDEVGSLASKTCAFACAREQRSSNLKLCSITGVSISESYRLIARQLLDVI